MSDIADAQNLADIIRAQGKARGYTTAFEFEGRRTSFAGLDIHTNRVANGLKAVGVKLLIEAINTRDIPGFFLCNTQQAVDIIKAVGSDNLFVQYDIYHAQRMEGELAATVEKYLPRIGHIHVTVDDLPWHWADASGEQLILTGLPVGPHKVLIETKASGLCHSDLSIIQAPVSRLPLPLRKLGRLRSLKVGHLHWHLVDDRATCDPLPVERT